MNPFWPEEKAELKPPEALAVSEWCNRNLVLLPATSREPGPYQWQRTPYCRDVLNLYQHPHIRHIVLKWATQIGKTQILYNLLAYILGQEPFPTMLTYPSESEAATISRSRVQPMIEGCKVLRARMPASSKHYHLTEMHFPGMPLYLSGANSATPLSQRPVRNLLRDEINKWPPLIKDMGDPLDLSEERLKSFWDIRKVIDVSSPTSETGNITRMEAKCQVILRYFVPCPECRRLQTLEWEQIKFDYDDSLKRNKRIAKAKASAQYACRFCGHRVGPELKEWMLDPENAAGWYPHDIEEPDPVDDPIGQLFSQFEVDGMILESVAFRLSSLYSPWLTWGDIAAKFLESNLATIQRFDKLRAFRNDWLGDEWVDVIESKQETDILAHRCDFEPLTVPVEAVCLTAGIDVQKICFWYVVRAWAPDGTSWLIRYGMLNSWADVRKMVFEDTYPVEGTDRRAGIWRAGIDTGGGRLTDDMTMTQECYQFLGTSQPGTWGIKGYVGGAPTQKVRIKRVNYFPGKWANIRIPGAGFELLTVDPNYFKARFHAGLQIKPGDPGCIYLHADTGTDYAKQIVSEEMRRDHRGHMSWVHVRGQNHLLDAEIYASVLVDPGCHGGLNVLQPRQPEVPKQEKKRPAERKRRPARW